MADAALDAFRNRHGSGDVPSKHRGRETIFGVVGDAHGFIHALDANDRLRWPKGLLVLVTASTIRSAGARSSNEPSTTRAVVAWRWRNAV
jgi:hypothetical protein